MLKIAVCDDNQMFLDQIKDYVHKWNNNTQIITFTDGDALISIIRNLHLTYYF